MVHASWKTFLVAHLEWKVGMVVVVVVTPSRLGLPLPMMRLAGPKIFLCPTFAFHSGTVVGETMTKCLVLRPCY
jgi:hypothetical protein